MSNPKVKAGVDSSNNANVEFYKNGSSNAMVKMVNETNEFKIQKHTGSSLVDVIKINEDGLVQFEKDVKFKGTNTIVDTETLSIRDQTVEIGLSETNQVNSSGITKSDVTQGTNTFTTDSNDSSNLNSGSTYYLSGKSSSYPSSVEISNYQPMSSYSISGSGTTWTTSSTNELSPSNMNESDMAFFVAGTFGSSHFNNVSPGSWNSSSGTLSLRLNYNTNLYNLLNSLTINVDLIKFTTTNTSGTPFESLFGRLTNLGLNDNSNPTIMYVTATYDTNISGYSFSSYSLPTTSSTSANITTYTYKSAIVSTSYSAGTKGYTFTLTDSNLTNPYSANEYVYLNNCLISGSAIFNTANKVASISGSTITIESSNDYTVANITDNNKIYMSKLSSVSDHSGVCIVGQNSGSFVDACLKYDNSTNLALQLENNSGKIKIGSDNVAQNITIAESGSRQVNIGSSSASDITLDTGSGVSIDAVSASNFTTSSGALTLSGAGGLTQVGGSNSTIAVTGTYDIDSTNALSLNSSGDAINIGNDAVNQNVNIGTGGTRTIALGNSNSTISIPGTVSLGGSLATDTIAGTSVTVSSSSTKVDIDAASTIDLDGVSGINIGVNNTSAIDMNATTLAIDSSDTTNLTMTANDASTKTMTISATNSDASNIANLDIDADGTITLDGASGITIGATNESAVDLNTTTLDIDASGALTLDSATSIAIGTNADKPIDIDSSTLAIDSSDTTNLTMTANATSTKTMTINASNSDSSNVANMDIDADGTITLDGASGITIGATNASALSLTTTTADINTTSLDIDASGELSLDSATLISIGTNADKPIDMDSSTLTIDSSDTTHLKMTANDASNKTMTLSASNSGSGVANIDINADGTVTLDGTSGITIGGTNASALSLTTTTLDIDASGALTLDSATSISIGTNADKPIDIDASSLNIDASSTTNFKTTGANMTISTITSGNMTQSSAGTYDLDVSNALSINSSGGVINIGNDNVSQNINIGTDGTRTITIGKDGVGTFQVDSENVVFTNSTQFSDIRLKENFLSIDKPLEKINNLNGYYYNWIKDETKKQHIGLIAQEVEAQFPMLITNQENGYKTVNYVGMIPVLLECIKDLQIQINDLKK